MDGGFSIGESASETELVPTGKSGVDETGRGFGWKIRRNCLRMRFPLDFSCAEEDMAVAINSTFVGIYYLSWPRSKHMETNLVDILDPTL